MAGDHELLSSAAQGTTLTVMARIGFGARGLVYLLVAVFATAAALDFGQQPHGIIDAVQAVANTQLQVILAGSIGAGLACLAAYFAISGVWQCCRGRGFRRWLFAAGLLGDALIYAVVMIAILSLVFGWHPDGEQQTQAWTGWILGQPFGPGLVGVVGFLILTCGIGVIVWVMTTDIDDDVDLPDSEKRTIKPLGRYGLVAAWRSRWLGSTGWRPQSRENGRRRTSLAALYRPSNRSLKGGCCCMIGTMG